MFFEESYHRLWALNIRILRQYSSNSSGRTCMIPFDFEGQIPVDFSMCCVENVMEKYYFFMKEKSIIKIITKNFNGGFSHFNVTVRFSDRFGNRLFFIWFFNTFTFFLATFLIALSSYFLIKSVQLRYCSSCQEL